MTRDHRGSTADLVRSLVEDPRMARPVTWQGVIDRGSTSAVAFPAPAPIPFGQQDSRWRARYSLLKEVERELRAPEDHRTLVVEVAVDAEGAVEVDRTFELWSIQPYSIVLDDRYRYPHHPLPGMPRPAAAEPTGRPTDPEVLRRARSSVDEFTHHYRRLKGREPRFGETRTEAELAAAEEQMGLRLPEDVRALHLLVGDDLREVGLLGRCCLLPLPTVVSRYLAGPPGIPSWPTGLFGHSRVVLEAPPPGAVRRLSRNDWWVDVATDFGGNSIAVDLDPGPRGRSGQLIKHGRDFLAMPGLLAESVTARLETVLAALREDRLEAEDHEGEAEAHENIGVDLPDGIPGGYSESKRIGAADLPGVVAGFPDPTSVQRLYLHDAHRLDLRALSVLPRLRELGISRTGRVDLWLPDAVEALSVEAGEADLSALAGHPALWDLTVVGPVVRVEHLAALPALARLDLSRTEVEDLEALVDLDVRVLVLNAGQWRRLRAAGRPPHRLAAAQWPSRHVGLAELVDWATWLRSA